MDGQHALHGGKSTDVVTISLIGATGLRDARPWGKGLNMGARFAFSSLLNASSPAACPSLHFGFCSCCSAFELGLTLHAQAASPQLSSAAAPPLHSLNMGCVLGCSEDEPLLCHQPWARAMEVQDGQTCVAARMPALSPVCALLLRCSPCADYLCYACRRWQKSNLAAERAHRCASGHTGGSNRGAQRLQQLPSGFPRLRSRAAVRGLGQPCAVEQRTASDLLRLQVYDKNAFKGEDLVGAAVWRLPPRNAPPWRVVRVRLSPPGGGGVPGSAGEVVFSAQRVCMEVLAAQ